MHGVRTRLHRACKAKGTSRSLRLLSRFSRYGLFPFVPAAHCTAAADRILDGSTAGDLQLRGEVRCAAAERHCALPCHDKYQHAAGCETQSIHGIQVRGSRNEKSYRLFRPLRVNGFITFHITRASSAPPRPISAMRIQLRRDIACASTLSGIHSLNTRGALRRTGDS